MSRFERAVAAIHDASVTIIAYFTWSCFGMLALAWSIYLKPLLPLPVIGFEAHPAVVEYLLWSAGTSLVLLLAATLLLRSAVRRYCPDVDVRPATADAAIARLGARGVGAEWTVRIAFHATRRRGG
ncbi:hypothetical protein M9980_08915 [Sphingomonas donggukensis]|uniref:Poly-beta-1,6-N-acetyl-D-glucosamine biosynthesis protein PgaD n=1 Tax=Sphingomonas donggukensis TaxID=2949093 RepID=A0ABY4TTG7_9SPHN|nr:hypothetical protein [Sphingomonas donggukensis]URW74697.1 hypothetical protein M9980_08915 [Sphingomonas donggukensis]